MVFEARYRGVCPRCGGVIRPGDMLRKNGPRFFTHAVCEMPWLAAVNQNGQQREELALGPPNAVVPRAQVENLIQAIAGAPPNLIGRARPIREENIVLQPAPEREREIRVLNNPVNESRIQRYWREAYRVLETLLLLCTLFLSLRQIGLI